GLAAAADQLQALHQEFDFADAAGAELEIVGQFALLHFAGDQRLHLAQAVDGAVVEVAAVDEGPQGAQQFLAGLDVAGHRPRLDPGVTFPVAALALEVLLHGIEAQGQPARGAEGAQAQVDAMAEALGGGVAQQLRQALAEAGEPGLRIQRPRAVALAGFAVGVDEVDVGAEVQFAAAQLAQAEHHQLLFAAADVADAAMTLRQLCRERLDADPQGLFGNATAAGQGGVHVVQAVQVAPDQAGGFGGAPATQAGGPVALFTGRQRGW